MVHGQTKLLRNYVAGRRDPAAHRCSWSDHFLREGQTKQSIPGVNLKK